MKRPLVVIGAGGHGGCICDVAEAAGWSVAGFLDTEQPAGARVLGFEVLGADERLDDPAFVRGHDFALGIGEPAVRRRYGQRLRRVEASLPRIAHPSCFVSRHARVGQGTLLMGFNAVNHQAVVEDFVVLDWHATVGHHSRVGEAAFLGPSVNVMGRATVEALAYLGGGGCVVPDVTVGEGTVIGAGSTVTRDLPARVLAVGSPAAVKRSLEQ